MTTASTISLDALARFGHALSDPTRARILMELNEAPAYPADLAVIAGISKQSVSNHLSCLRGCGLVEANSEGRRVRYELANDQIKHALTDLRDLVVNVDPVACAETQAKDCC